MKKRGRAGQAIYDNIIQRMLLACWITKATDTHSEYVIGVLIFFPQQLWLHESFSLRYTYVACLVKLQVQSRISVSYQRSVIFRREV